jgi:hypothetical protein
MPRARIVAGGTGAHRALAVVSAAAACLAACSNVSPGAGGILGPPKQSSLTVPLPPVTQFLVLASHAISVGDRSVLAGGHVGVAAGPASAPGSLTAGSDARVGIGEVTLAQAVVLHDRAATGELAFNTLNAPLGTTGPRSAYVAPPAAPAPGPVNVGTGAVAVAAGQAATLGAGRFAGVSVDGTLNLSGGLYEMQSLRLGPGAVVNVLARSIVRVATGVSGADRVHVLPQAPLGARDLRLVLGGTVDGSNAITCGNDCQITALVVAQGGLLTADRLIASGAFAVRDFVVGQDANVAFDTGFGCNTNASCPGSGGNGCSVAACVDAQCKQTQAPNGTACNDGNACTQSDSCQGGACVGTNPVTCAAADQCHAAGTCNPATGACSNPPKTDGTACDDGDACSQTDTCQAGSCVGSNRVTCAPPDACHLAGACSPASGQCVYPAKTDGTACDDGNPCTLPGVCQAGACQGQSPVVCAAADQCHAAGTCDPSTGACTNPPLPDGTSCIDGNACTQVDVCMAGTCVGTAPVTCPAADQCHVASGCDPTTGACMVAAKVDGTPCNDGNACTQLDTCQAGACVGGSQVTCAAQDDCHDPGACNPMTGACSNPTKADGASCDDKNACTHRDVCQLGRCTGLDPVTCTASDQCHDVGTCDPGSGACSNPAKTDGTACDDKNACTQKDSCQAGACMGASPVTCTAQDACHVAGTCDPSTGTCSNPAAADGTSCNDRNACTQTDTCQAGTCVGTNPVVCPSPDQCHQPSTCDTLSGACIQAAKPDGTPCDDANVCTSGDSCRAGVCAAGINGCVALTVSHATPTVRRVTGQTSGTLTVAPTQVIPGDPVAFTATVTNNGTLLEFGGGVINVTNTNKDTPFTVLGYTITLESLSPNGAWTVVASFQRDNDGAAVAPVAPAISIGSFAPLLTPGTQAGVTRAANAPDQMFATQIAPGATASWSYSYSVQATAVALAALSQGSAIRSMITFDTSVSPQPVTAAAAADYSQLLAGVDGVLHDPALTITFLDFVPVVPPLTVPSPAGTVVQPGTTFAFQVPPFPTPALPARGQAPLVPAGETESQYLSRLFNAQPIGYGIRAQASGRLAVGDLPTIAFGLSSPLRQLPPILILTTTPPGSVASGQPLPIVVSIQNQGPSPATLITLTDSLGGVLGGFAPLPLGPNTTGRGTFTTQIPAGVAGSVTDVITMTWRDQNGNSYGTLSNTITFTVTAPVGLAGDQPLAFAADGLGAQSALAAAGLLRPSAAAAVAPMASVLARGASGVLRSTAPAQAVGAPSLGRVVVRAVDASVTLGDLPITIARRYDSADQDRVGDFGHGWSLALEPRIEVDPARAGVAVSLGDGRRVPFWLGLARYSDAVASLFRPLYAPEPGASGTLASDGCPLLTVDDGKLTCFMEAGLEYTPSTYTYTDAAGRVFTMSAAGEPRSVRAADGGTVTFTADGVAGADGAPVVELLRDGAGRIEHIVVRDGAGERSYDYLYDAAGDLRAVGPTAMEYTYDATHRLSTLRDSDGLVRATGAGGGTLEQSVAPAVAPACTPGFALTDWLAPEGPASEGCR